MWDQPGVHDIYRRWRKVTDSYAGEGEDADRILCAEAWVRPTESLALYVRGDELHQSFNFCFLMSPWIASEMQPEITARCEAVEEYAAPQTWVLSNHDVVRHASRLGFDPVAGLLRMEGVGADDPQPDAEVGLRRARAATTVMLALPGSAYLYQGEELGLPEATQLPDEAREDPTWEKSVAHRGRDGCRVPIPWEGDAPAYGFGPTESRGCRSPRRTATSPSIARPGSRGRPSSSTGRCCACVASSAPGAASSPGSTSGSTRSPSRSAPSRVPRARDRERGRRGPVARVEVLVASDELDPAGGVPTDCAVWLRLS